MPDPLIDQLISSTKLVREPLGSRAIPPANPAQRSGRDEILTAIHQVWKSLHLKAIGEIITIDTIESKHKERPIDAGFVAYLCHLRQAWRRINDSLVWQLFAGQRHVVKRLCLYRERGPLVAANADSALAVLEILNGEPLVIAFWNDATSCVDIGDIIKFDESSRSFSLIELKEGRVNKEIIDLITQGVDEGIYSRLNAFYERYGDPGIKQVERVVRQAVRSNQAVSLMQHEKGTDPVTGKEMEIQELATPDSFYDAELAEVIARAMDRGSAVTVVDGCLWIYADFAPRLTLTEIQNRCANSLLRENPALEEGLSRAFRAKDARRAVLLSQGLYYPVSRPPFLRNVDPELIVATTCGNFRTRVWLYLDWDAFARVAEGSGGVFSWSTEKEARRERSAPRVMRMELVDGKLPKITVGEVGFGITGANMVQMMFDGLTPRTFAMQLVESARRLEEMARSRNAT